MGAFRCKWWGNFRRRLLLSASLLLIACNDPVGPSPGPSDGPVNAPPRNPPAETPVPPAETPVPPAKTPVSPTVEEEICLRAGWNLSAFSAGGHSRKVLWKSPAVIPWPAGAILLLHGGGGKASDFCTGGTLVDPQIQFARLALNQGFAVFALDSTQDIVTDSLGRTCGKRFDFSVLDRPNVDLPYIEYLLTQFVPTQRPAGSNSSVFMAGLSTGGYMTIRASTHFDNLVTAFAPIAAGDPYGTDTICDPSLSPRDSAIGILVDRETRLEVTTDDACMATNHPNESAWESRNPSSKPKFKQFHHKKDGIVDFSCMLKASSLLIENGYPAAASYVVSSLGAKQVLLHLWLYTYNQPLIEFFRQEAGL